MADEGFVVDGSITVDGVNIDLTGTTVGSTLLRTNGSFSAVQETPVGTIIMYAGAIGAATGYSGLPSGWLLCDGAEYDSTDPDYSSLYAVIGNRYNTGGETSGYFRVPNLADKVPVGHIQSNTSAINTISSSTAGDANHQHTYTYGAGNNTGYDPSSHSHTLNSDGAHNHGATSSNKGSHTHGPTDFNVGSHSHGYDFGNIGANTSNVSGGDNHGHDMANANANHGHNASAGNSANHNHNVTNADLPLHTHSITINSFSANQSSNTHSHSTGIATVGFFFIIKV